MGDPVPALVEQGNGFWCFRVLDPADQPALIASSGDGFPDDLPQVGALEVYHPVQVDVNDDGDAYAWFFYDYDDPLKTAKLNGKRYARLEQVYLKPLSGFEDIRSTEAEIP